MRIRRIGGVSTFVAGEVTGGAVGGNSASRASCGRIPMTDVSGLKAALSLAGVSTSETCAATAAFGSSGYGGKHTARLDAGIGGGIGGATTGSAAQDHGTGGAVILYFI